MYCVKCGVELADTEKQCPLCGTVVYHPAIRQETVQPLYPAGRFPAQRPRSLTAPIMLSTAFLLPLLITLLCDLQINQRITWSGYVMGALAVGYVILVVPLWFKKPNLTVLIISDFMTVAFYLLYINHETGGNWFWSFGLPVVGAVGLAVTAVVVLLRHFPKAGLYIFGGAQVALGLFMPLMEYLIDLTFHHLYFAAWSLYPLVALVLLGLMLIFLGANSAARQILERKFFI